jgi:hypothetical protein
MRIIMRVIRICKKILAGSFRKRGRITAGVGLVRGWLLRPACGLNSAVGFAFAASVEAEARRFDADGDTETASLNKTMAHPETGGKEKDNPPLHHAAIKPSNDDARTNLRHP